MSKACPVCGWKAIGNAEETVCPECGHELEYTRSGLFMEQIRIIKEMRQNDRNHGRAGMLVRPRYCIWENVPGALSSNNGKDFQAVLTEFARVGQPNAPDVPMPETGKWPKAGCIYDELGGWSIAYRIHDAQYWGVPQRRRRISVLADFNGLSAAEILFDPQLRGEAEDTESNETERDPSEKPGREVPPVCESVSGHLEPRGAAGKGASIGIESGADGAGYGIDQQGEKGGAAFTVGVAPTLAGDSHGTPHAVAYGISSYDSNAMKSPNPHSGIYKADTARTLDLNGGSPACNQGGVAVVTAVDCRNGTENPGTNGTLQAKDSGGTSLNLNNVVRTSGGQ